MCLFVQTLLCYPCTDALTHTPRRNNVVHCRALPNRSAATRYDFEDTPRLSLHIYVGKNAENVHKIYVEGKGSTALSHNLFSWTCPSLILITPCTIIVHARYRHLVVDPAGSLTPRPLGRPAERHDEFGRRGTCIITLHEESCTPGIVITWTILRGV